MTRRNVDQGDAPRSCDASIEVSRNVFERRVDRKKREWRVDVRQREDDRERAVEQKLDGVMRDVKILQQAVQDAVAAEDGFPGVAANEIAGPQGNDHELIEQVLSFRRVKRKIVRERISEEQSEQRDRGGDRQ